MNTIGSLGCSCDAGFDGSGVLCLDADEYALNFHNNHVYANCSNILGSFECECSAGSQGMECSVEI